MINNNWVFGGGCGLSFSTHPPTPSSGYAMATTEGCSSISDDNGNLLFYTDGRTIWDSSNIVRVQGLLGNSSSTQSVIIVSDPSNSEQYYVLTSDGITGANNHFDGGLLNVTTWNFTPLASLMTMPSVTWYSPVERVTAVQHADCKNFWVITMIQKGGLHTQDGDGIFRVFRIDISGIQHVGDTPLGEFIGDIGYLKGSPDGKKISFVDYNKWNIKVYDFDSASGVIDVNNVQTISVPKNGNYGLEFSPNSQLLYFSNLPSASIYQVDLVSNTAPLLVGQTTGFVGALQLGPDHIIYGTRTSTNILVAILDPDVVGTGCNFDQNYITLASGTLAQGGLPNMISNLCSDSSNEDCNCGCSGCNEDADDFNKELIERANEKYNTVKSDNSCPDPFSGNCSTNAIDDTLNLEPCFYFHWGDSKYDGIEEHDTEVFYLTICNGFKDIMYKGLTITKITLIPDVHPIDKIHIVPDRLIEINCLEPCSCQTREFALITRANDTAGNYTLEVAYCYDEIVIPNKGSQSKVKFPIEIIKD